MPLSVPTEEIPSIRSLEQILLGQKIQIFQKHLFPLVLQKQCPSNFNIFKDIMAFCLTSYQPLTRGSFSTTYEGTQIELQILFLKGNQNNTQEYQTLWLDHNTPLET